MGKKVLGIWFLILVSLMMRNELAKDHKIHPVAYLHRQKQVASMFKKIQKIPQEIAMATGEASWYGIGDDTQGHATASTIPFDTTKPMCAMWGPKFGTWVRIVNLSNHKSARCQILDRGPAKRLHRAIDLSHLAKEQIGMSDLGRVAVYLEKPLQVARVLALHNEVNN
jgi:rare lipoprotein A (peptidoglycan hydrolase)